MSSDSKSWVDLKELVIDAVRHSVIIEEALGRVSGIRGKSTTYDSLQKAWQQYQKEDLTLPALKDSLDSPKHSPDVELTLQKMRQEVLDARKVKKEILKELEAANVRLDLALAISDTKALNPPKIVKSDPKIREVTAVALASDWHVEELVDPRTVNGKNEYNPDISRQRAAKFFDNVRWLVEQHQKGYNLKNLILWLGGDMITGYIHEEFMETNALSPTEACMLFQEYIISGIDYLLANTKLEKLFIPCSFGNHGRTGPKRRIATGATNSFEWLSYHSLRQHYKNEKRVEFIIADGSHLYMDVYQWKVSFHHGDDVKYGGGIGGLSIPLMKAIDSWNEYISADITCIGHYHSYEDFKNCVVNGCFVRDTRILVPGGFKSIQEIKSGDEVFSADGSVQLVENTTSRMSEEGIVELGIKGLPHQLFVTPNHEIWAIKGEQRLCARGAHKWEGMPYIEEPQWIPAEYLSQGDWVHAPHLIDSSISRKDIDKDLAWVYGLFMAEGHTIVEGGASERHFRIEFSMHKDELKVLERAKGILDKEIGYPGRVWVRDNRNTSHLSYSGEEVSREWREWFGHLASGKRIPDWMFFLPTETRRSIVEGWIDGDGHRGKQLSATTISEQLAWGMYMLSGGTGLEPSLLRGGTKFVKGREGRMHAPWWRVGFDRGQDVRWVNGQRFLRICHRRRSKVVSDVYDLQVTGNHTYIAAGVGVHNSLIGYNAYALHIKARYEPPRQAFFLIDSERGKIQVTPVWVD